MESIITCIFLKVRSKKTQKTKRETEGCFFNMATCKTARVCKWMREDVTGGFLWQSTDVVTLYGGTSWDHTPKDVLG